MADRKIRIGMVGGGKNAFIGGVHRIALRLDGHYELVAGSFSSNFDNSKETGKDLGLTDDRVYETYQEMAEKESKIKALLNLKIEIKYSILKNVFGTESSHKWRSKEDEYILKAIEVLNN